MTDTFAPPATSASFRHPTLHLLLRDLIAFGGSDLHLASGEAPRIRVHGELAPLDGQAPFDAQSIFELLHETMPVDKMKDFVENCDTDLAYEMDEKEGHLVTSRFRVNLSMSRGEPVAVFRVIPTHVVPLDRLGHRPAVTDLAANTIRGLFLVTGITGSGKSTTTAGVIDYVNDHRRAKIITLEDPVEYVHRSKQSMITQREVGRDSKSFSAGLKHALRQDPDVLFVGELRDLETVETAIEAADTGHLVIATLHTQSASDTIGRIVGFFPATARDGIRTKLASVLAGVVSQALIPGAKGGRVIATEILIPTDGIRNNIRQDKPEAIDQAMQSGTHGSIRFDTHLEELYRSGAIARKHAIANAFDPDSLSKRIGSPTF